MTTPKNFTIVHLSDLHLTAADNASRTEPRLFGALKGMNESFRALLKRPELQTADLIIVTGDITDRGEKEAWNVFWDALQQARLKDRTMAIPGNHDVCDLSLLRLSGNAKTDLDKAVIGLKMGNQKFRFPWSCQPHPCVVVFALNSNNLGNKSVASNALGKVDYFQFEEFARLLRHNSNVPIKIVAIHHSPNIPGKDTAIKRRQKPMSKINRLAHELPQPERRTLRLLCLSHGVRLIIHGHLHEAETRRVTGLQIIGAPATTEPIVARPKNIYRFWQYSLNPQSLRMTHKLCYVPVP